MLAHAARRNVDAVTAQRSARADRLDIDVVGFGS